MFYIIAMVKNNVARLLLNWIKRTQRITVCETVGSIYEKKIELIKTAKLQRASSKIKEIITDVEIL